MSRRVAILAALAGAAALPASASARPPEPPPVGCVATTQGVICVSDLPQYVSDPGGTVNRLVCYTDVRICE